MICPRCHSFAWPERDPECGEETVCIVGHRVSLVVPLSIPAAEKANPNGMRAPRQAGRKL